MHKFTTNLPEKDIELKQAGRATFVKRSLGRHWKVMAAAVVVLVIVVVTAVTLSEVLSKNDTDRYAREKDPSFWLNNAKEDLQKTLNAVHHKGVAKNVILFLGDGMGAPSVTAGRILAGQQKGLKGEEYSLAFDSFPHTGLSKTYNVDSQTTDSAASGTAYLTGVKTNQEMLGVSAKAKNGDCASAKGAEVDSILKWFADQGRPTGIVTTTRITHATPAAAYAHTVSRYWETDADINPKYLPCEDITSQLISKSHTINVLMGGGRTNFRTTNYTDPISTSEEPIKGRRQDGRDLIEEWNSLMKAKGFTHEYITTRDELLTVNRSTKHVLGLFSPSHMSYEVDRDKKVQPSLAEMTQKAIEILQANTKDSKGFFLLVEGGRIDQAHHLSSAVKALHEVVTFSDAVQTATKMTSEEDTLIVVTADHSHSMSFAGYPTRGNPIFEKATMDKEILDQYVIDKHPFTTLLYANGPGYKVPRPDLTNVDTADKNYINQGAVPITESTHGGEDVSIYARGPHAFLYTGVHEQNYIPMLMAYASCVGPIGSEDLPCAANSTQNNS